jgi:F-type H+-transporting ATPase subunit b
MNLESGILAEVANDTGIYHITFDWPVFFSQLFGFACIVFVIVKWVTPPIKRMMTKAQDTIQKQIEQSEQAATRLAEAKQAYDSALAQAQAELAQLREDAHADAERIVARMREAADAEVARVRKHGRDQIAQMRTQLIRDLKVDLSATVLARTEDKVRYQLSSTYVVTGSIDKFLEDLEAMANASPPVRRRAQPWTL